MSHKELHLFLKGYDIMCGICGQISFCRNLEEYREYFYNMQNKLINRGPDQHGEYFSCDAVLMHRRLAVIDIENNGVMPIIIEVMKRPIPIKTTPIPDIVQNAPAENYIFISRTMYKIIKQMTNIIYNHYLCFFRYVERVGIPTPVPVKKNTVG